MPQPRHCHGVAALIAERLWRSLKYEEIYLKEYASAAAPQTALKAYFEFCNFERLQPGPPKTLGCWGGEQSLNGEPPQRFTLAKTQSWAWPLNPNWILSYLDRNCV